MTKLIFIFFLYISTFSVWSQSALLRDSSKLIQLSGVAISESDMNPLPYTTVYDRSIRKGVISDYYGFFSTVVLPGDTLLFSSFGYKTSTYIVPDTLKDNRYSVIHMLQIDTVDLPSVTVYPWPSREDFAKAFVEMEPYDDAIRRAQRELSGESLAFVAAKLENDASLAYGYATNQRNTKLYTNGQLPVNNLLSPYAWAKLIQDWKEGKLSRQ